MHRSSWRNNIQTSPTQREFFFSFWARCLPIQFSIATTCLRLFHKWTSFFTPLQSSRPRSPAPPLPPMGSPTHVLACVAYKSLLSITLHGNVPPRWPMESRCSESRWTPPTLGGHFIVVNLASGETGRKREAKLRKVQKVFELRGFQDWNHERISNSC